MNDRCRQRRMVLLWILFLGMGAIMPSLRGQTPDQVKQQKELAKEQQKFADLQKHLPSEKGVKQAQTLAELAHINFDFAHAAYDAGNVAGGRSQLQSAQAYAAQAMQVVQQEAATGHTGGMKKVEMEFQEIAYGLHDLSQSADFQQRPPIDAAQRYFAEQRDQVLSLMFTPHKKEKKG